MNIQNIANKETADQNEQQLKAKKDFKEMLKIILNSNSFKNEFQKLIAR